MTKLPETLRFMEETYSIQVVPDLAIDGTPVDGAADISEGVIYLAEFPEGERGDYKARVALWHELLHVAESSLGVIFPAGEISLDLLAKTIVSIQDQLDVTK